MLQFFNLKFWESFSFYVTKMLSSSFKRLVYIFQCNSTAEDQSRKIRANLSVLGDVFLLMLTDRITNTLYNEGIFKG